MNGNFENMTPAKALLQMRLIWGALLAGQLIFMVFVIVYCLNNDSPSLEADRILYGAATGVCLVIVLMASYIRMQIYKRHWVENAVTPQGYVSGQVVSLGMIEGANMLSLVIIFLGGKFDVTFSLPIALLAVFLTSFPNGKPMEPAMPDYLNQPPNHLKK